MDDDRIEHEIAIAASPERVWATLTEAGLVSAWLGGGQPAEVDLRPGRAMVLPHGDHGPLLARFERVEAPRFLSYRWSQDLAGQEPDDGNATLVEFTLHPADGGTRLTVVESGFARLALPAGARRSRHAENTVNWPRALARLRGGAESLR